MNMIKGRALRRSIEGQWRYGKSIDCPCRYRDPLRGSRMAQRSRHPGCRPSEGVERHLRGVAWLQVVQKRRSETRRGERIDLKQVKLRISPNLGWVENKFDTKIVVDTAEHVAPTHKVDCYKKRVALEVEWNNKDPFFYDRDLNNFRLLFDLRAIDAGVIITRCTELQQIFNKLGRGRSFGNSTTHMAKLLPRLEGGGGGGCPVVVFGIRGAAYVED